MGQVGLYHDLIGESKHQLARRRDRFNFESGPSQGRSLPLCALVLQRLVEDEVELG